ncbi:fungal-specific transcription factor domain-containing protein [Aspergillus insuetus]
MDSAARLLTQKRKKRVAAACDFCRRRKLGCDNTSPRCGNCQSYEKQCTYAARARQARPSNSRIRQLEEENARLRRLSQGSVLQSAERAFDRESVEQQIPAGGPVPTGSHREDDLVEETVTLLDEPSGLTPPVRDHRRHSNHRLSRHYASQPDRESRFHGPSSAMFDESYPINATVVGSYVAKVDYRKCQLLAETTRQRQMEMINISSGKLDFDGVEPEMGLKLLTIFWNRQHHSGSTVYRPAFMRDMACNGPSFSKLLLNAIYFSAADYLSRAAASGVEGPIAARCQAADNCTLGFEFRRKFEDYLHDRETALRFRSQVTTIQALLLVSDTLFSWCDEKSLSWHYSGIAVNMIIDLGLHTEGQDQKATSARLAGELETHRRLFWAAFVTDKLQSVYQGRPARLREHDNSVPIAFLDEYEELEPFSTDGYAAEPTSLSCPGHGVSTFEQLCKLSVIMDRVLLNIYAESSSQKDPNELFRTSDSLDEDLKAWRKGLPTHLAGLLIGTGNAPVLPHTISLLALYNSIITLLHRPFVSDGHLRGAGQPRASSSFAICAAAASSTDALLRQYTDRFCVKSAPYALSYAVYVSATIHLRIAAQRPPCSEAHHSLRNCLDFLHEHQIMCYASRRTLTILKDLMKRLKVDESVLTQSRHSTEVDNTFGGGSCGANTLLAPAGSQAAMVADGSPSSGSQFGRDLIDPTLDIDQIMKSFDCAPQLGGAYGSPGALDGNPLALDGALYGTLEGFDMFSSFDNLFGLDL